MGMTLDEQIAYYTEFRKKFMYLHQVGEILGLVDIIMPTLINENATLAAKLKTADGALEAIAAGELVTWTVGADSKREAAQEALTQIRGEQKGDTQHDRK